MIQLTTRDVGFEATWAHPQFPGGQCRGFAYTTRTGTSWGTQVIAEAMTKMFHEIGEHFVKTHGISITITPFKFGDYVHFRSSIPVPKWLWWTPSVSPGGEMWEEASTPDTSVAVLLARLGKSACIHYEGISVGALDGVTAWWQEAGAIDEHERAGGVVAALRRVRQKVTP